MQSVDEPITYGNFAEKILSALLAVKDAYEEEIKAGIVGERPVII